jgi:ubiquinone/menaquinone biosynthesis C-methylase UbiE
VDPDAVADFTFVDQTDDASFFLRFVAVANRLPGVVASKAEVIDGLRLRDGDRVLDAGCGIGDDVLALARRVGRKGHVVGIDVSEAMIAATRDAIAESGLHTEALTADVQALPFEDASFDACRCERVLMHVTDAGIALTELVRVLRSGGRLSIFDVDCDSMVVDATDHDTTRAVVRSFGDAIRHGWIGRQLPRRMRELGIDELDVRTRSILVDFEVFAMMMGGHLARATAAGELDGPAVSAWYNELAQREREGTFIATLNAFIVAGTRRA